MCIIASHPLQYLSPAIINLENERVRLRDLPAGMKREDEGGRRKHSKDALMGFPYLG
jgi:hypothetical protein